MCFNKLKKGSKVTVTQLEFDETWIDHNWVKNVQAPRPSAACKAWHMAYDIWYAEFPLLPLLPLLHALHARRQACTQRAFQLAAKVRYQIEIHYLEALVNRWMVLARTQAHAR